MHTASHGSAGQHAARQGWARHDAAHQGRARQGKLGLGLAVRRAARLDLASLGLAGLPYVSILRNVRASRLNRPLLRRIREYTRTSA